MREGVEGLLRYKSNPPGKTSVPPKRVAEIVRPHAETPPHEVTHWTARAMNECPVPRGAPRSGLAAFYQLQPKTPTPVINPSVSCTGANGDLRSRWVSCHSAASKGAKGRFRHMLTFIMMHSNVAVWVDICPKAWATRRAALPLSLSEPATPQPAIRNRGSQP